MHSYSILVMAAAASVQLTHVGAKGQPRARLPRRLDEDDDDDCTPGYGVLECRDDGTLMHNSGCDSCGCEAVEDLTAASDGQYTCEPGTNTYYYDEDIDGNIELEAQFEACGYDDCSEDDDDDDDDCAEGWRVFDCLDDGTVMHGEGCTSCEGCDLWDFTAASEGRVTCKRDGHGSYSYSYSHSYSYSYRTAT